MYAREGRGDGHCRRDNPVSTAVHECSWARIRKTKLRMRARQLGLEDFLGASLAASEEEALGTSTAFNSLPLRRCCTGDWPQCRICMGSAKQQAPGVQRRPSANSTTARPPLLDMPVARRCGPGKKKSQLYLLTETQETLFFCTQQGRRVDRQSPGLKVRTTRKSS